MDTQEIATVGQTAITQTEPVEDGNDEFNIVARYPYQMKACQDRLVAWAAKKIEDMTAEVADLEENYRIAVKNKWGASGIKRAWDRSKKRLEFYQKVKMALDAGYCVVPDFPVDLFAIRTKKSKPVPNTREHSWHVPAQTSQTLPAGQGQYVSDEADVYRRDLGVVNGKEMKEYFANNFREVDFPFALAKPAILKNVERALVDKFFDEIGALPGKRGKGDPIIIGRIKNPEPYKPGLTFLISWFIDLRDLP